MDTGQEELGTIQYTGPQSQWVLDVTTASLLQASSSSLSLPCLACRGEWAPTLAPTQLCSWPPPRPQGLLGPKPELKLQTQQSCSSLVPDRGGGGVTAAGERAGGFSSEAGLSSPKAWASCPRHTDMWKPTHQTLHRHSCRYSETEAPANSLQDCLYVAITGDPHPKGDSWTAGCFRPNLNSSV